MTDTVLKSSDIDNHLGEVQTDRARAIHHSLAYLVIILFSLYYFAIESQSYDLGDYRNISFLTNPDLFEFYKTPIEYEGLTSFHINLMIRMKNVPEVIEYEYIPTVVTFLKLLNNFTGNPIISAKLLILPKLLIYLLGMYSLLYFFSKRFFVSLLVSILSIIPRFVFMQDHWGIGPFFSTQPKDLVYSTLPFIFLIFLNHKNDLKMLCILYFIIGVIGNIHPPAAINFAALFSFSQLLIQNKLKNKVVYAFLPILCALAGVLPFIVDNAYKSIVLNNNLVDGDIRKLSALFQGIKSLPYKFLSPISKASSSETINKLIFAAARPLFSLNTLIFFLPFGFYFYRKEFKDKGIKRTIKVQLIYLFILCLLGYAYAVAGFDAGGYLAYLGRSTTFIYLYIFIFLTFCIRKIFDIVRNLINRKMTRLQKGNTPIVWAANTLVAVLIVLLIYPPFSLKPNRHFPKYNFASQIENISDFVSKGILIGSVDPEFTEMAKYVANSSEFSKEFTFVVRYYADFIILSHMPTYEFPPALAGDDDMLSLYEKVVGRAPTSWLDNYMKGLIFGDLSYREKCKELVDEVEKYAEKNSIDYVILNIRYLPYLTDKLNVVWSNDKYVICQNSYIEGG